ncbi:arginine--tRNA ligase [Dactylosporangium sp. AC04546]|uniref:arginine--tRNA ligase n=1 Tax=Dactylosporangium sp. AC04546 TaxID=2862460 RepID=UPI001EE0D490|nr:arginine--tRNA ligase [Dactylosporangium sp. AC04546]WVK83520.1 arginine--tRNA ligase [Dactylosporangium sp. AC04546]
MADIEQLLHARLARAFAAVAGGPVDPAVQRSQRADYQSGAALGLARSLKTDPRALAAKVLDHADLDDLCGEIEVSGPGFINLTLADEVLGRNINELDDRLGVSTVDEPETVVVDYSGPNAAKEMHVGHLRSTVIGDAVVRLLEFLGHRVIRQNHLGDWGTPFGMLIEQLAGDERAGISELGELYVQARRRFDAEPEFRRKSRERVVLLQAGDADTLRLWRAVMETSRRHFLAMYGRLGVRLQDADFAGESSYNAELDGIVSDLDTSDSDGAACVFPQGFTNRDGGPLPLIVRKSDGGYGYAATDLAALRHRIEDLKATRILYLIGEPQHLHLQLVFATAREAGWLVPPVRAEHIGFGSVLGADGKLLRSREGGTVKLADLLDEAVGRAAVHNADPEISEAVGIGAVKYADLSNDRAKDYVLDFDRMLSLKGNTSVYLQYAHARVRSIGERATTGREEPTIAHPAERRLALELLRFPAVIRTTSQTLEFHHLTGYLFGLATAFSAFYEHCRVLGNGGRLTLSDRTAQTLRTGLGLLGIAAPERM